MKRLDCALRDNCESAYGKNHDCPPDCGLHFSTDSMKTGSPAKNKFDRTELKK